jgi:hypothetical protein
MLQITLHGNFVGRFSMLQFCYSYTLARGAVVDLVADAVYGVRVFGCRSCPAPLSVSLAESVSRSQLSSREAVKPSKIACIAFEPLHPAESTAEPRKSRETPKF